MNDILAFSALDSDRFGMRVFRGRAETVNTRSLLREIVDSQCDVAIVRVPAANSAAVSALSRHAMPVLHCDTLVYYTADLRNHEPKLPRNSDLLFRHARADDRDALGALIAHTFVDYTSHYHGNPLFTPESILAGYRQWGESFLGTGVGTLWVAERGGQIVAFAACAEDTESSTGEGVLYGVAPDASGSGIYGDLIRMTQSDFKRRGFERMKVSTQVQNFAVQKVWAREGFWLTSAWDTFHVNALLGAGELVYRGSRVFGQDEVDAFARVSGDGNPVHVDPQRAKDAGFAGTIVHGVFGAAEISRILGTHTPGAGTILTHLDLAFFRPVLTGQAHEVVLRVIGGLRASGAMQVVAQILDGSGAICLLGRADIVRK